MIRSQVRRPIPGREDAVRMAFKHGRIAEWLADQTPRWQWRRWRRRRRAYNRAMRRWLDNSSWTVVNGGWATPRFPHHE